MRGVIEMLDIRTPNSSVLQREQLAAAEKVPFEQTVDAIVAAAVDRTGLDDFGPEDVNVDKPRLGNTAGSSRQLEDYMATHHGGAGRGIVVNLRRNFRVDPAELRERYASYMDSLPVEIEAR